MAHAISRRLTVLAIASAAAGTAIFIGPAAPAALAAVHPDASCSTAYLPLPDPACTPGAIDPAVNQSNIKATICTPGYTATVRPPAADTDKWKRVTEGAYGVAAGQYDQPVPLELGGANATSEPVGAAWIDPQPEGQRWRTGSTVRCAPVRSPWRLPSRPSPATGRPRPDRSGF